MYCKAAAGFPGQHDGKTLQRMLKCIPFQASEALLQIDV